MTVFIDANVLVYTATASEYAHPCEGIVAAVAANLDGKTSAATLEEVWHLELTIRGSMGSRSERTRSSNRCWP